MLVNSASAPLVSGKAPDEAYFFRLAGFYKNKPIPVRLLCSLGLLLPSIIQTGWTYASLLVLANTPTLFKQTLGQTVLGCVAVVVSAASLASVQFKYPRCSVLLAKASTSPKSRRFALGWLVCFGAMTLIFGVYLVSGYSLTQEIISIIAKGFSVSQSAAMALLYSSEVFAVLTIFAAGAICAPSAAYCRQMWLDLQEIRERMQTSGSVQRTEIVEAERELRQVSPFLQGTALAATSFYAVDFLVSFLQVIGAGSLSEISGVIFAPMIFDALIMAICFGPLVKLNHEREQLRMEILHCDSEDACMMSLALGIAPVRVAGLEVTTQNACNILAGAFFLTAWSMLTTTSSTSS